jgi:hypothetical protein
MQGSRGEGIDAVVTRGALTSFVLLLLTDGGRATGEVRDLYIMDTEAVEMG